VSHVPIPQSVPSVPVETQAALRPGRGNRIAFYGALAFALSWWTILVFTWFSTANPPLVSGPQVRASDSILVANITEPVESLPGQPVQGSRLVGCTIQVTDALLGEPLQGAFHVTFLAREGDWPVGATFLWPVVPASATPLRLQGEAAEGFVVTRLPGQNGDSLIYPDTPVYRRLIEKAAERR
jgi:hypothetical protein